jgi:hypothetical protein
MALVDKLLESLVEPSPSSNPPNHIEGLRNGYRIDGFYSHRISPAQQELTECYLIHSSKRQIDCRPSRFEELHQTFSGPVDKFEKTRTSQK